MKNIYILVISINFMKKRGQTKLLWILVAVLIIVIIGLLLYFVLKQPSITDIEKDIDQETNTLGLDEVLVKNWNELNQSVEVTVNSSDESYTITAITFKLISNGTNCLIEKNVNLPPNSVQTFILPVGNCLNVINVEIFDIVAEEPAQNVTCSSNIDCGTTEISQYCNNESTCTSTATPTCYNPSTSESYCANSVSIDCDSCGFGCDEGICLSPPGNVTCTDSDGGVYYYEDGQVYIGSNLSGDDYCSGDLIVEYYCYSDGVGVNNYECPWGCQDGACIGVDSNETVCIDSDGGINYDVAGQIEGNIGSGYPNEVQVYLDYCLNPTSIIERYCTSDYTDFTIQHNCENGCYEGACIELQLFNCGDGTCEGISEERTINNGEDITVNYKGLSYRISAIVLSYDEVRFIVNGENTPTLSEFTNNKYLLSNGVPLYVTDIAYQAFVGGIQSANFFLGEDERSCPEDCQMNVTCEDSDGGLNYHVKGYLNTSVSPNTYFEDYCLPGYSDQLIERHCLSDNPNNFTVQATCENGCSNGACVEDSTAECSLGPELIANGDFNDDSNWIMETIAEYPESWNISGGEAHSHQLYPGYIKQQVNIEAGKTYRLQWGISSGGRVTPKLGAVGIIPESSPGDYVKDIVITETSGSDYLSFSGGRSRSVVPSIDDVSLREVIGELTTPELVVNGGFDSGLSGWDAFGRWTWENWKDGEAKIFAETYIGGTTRGVQGLDLSQDIGVEAGKRYKISVTLNGGYGNIVLGGIGDNVVRIYEGTQTYSIVAENNEDLLRFYDAGGQQNAPAYIDDISVKEDDCEAEPSTNPCGDGTCSGVWQVKTASDTLELNEPIVEIVSYIDKDELPTLADGEIVNEKGVAEYGQYLYFWDSDASVFYQEDNDENIGLFYKITSGDIIAKYSMDFTTNLLSDITPTNNLEDIEGKSITMIGKTYTITNATIDSNKINLTLINGADIIQLNGGMSMVVNGEIINNANVIITSSKLYNEVSISQIAIIMTAEDDLYVPINGKLSEAADLDEPEVLITQNWDILFSGLEDVEYEEFSINKATDNKMRLSFLNYNGDLINLPLVYVNWSGIFTGEKEGYNLILNTSRKITKNDYFILNTANPVIAGNDARSFVVQYKGADKAFETDPKCNFNVLGVDPDKEVSLSSQGICILKLGGASFIFKNTTPSNVNDFNIILDSPQNYQTTNGASISNYVRTKHNALVKLTDSNAWSNTDPITVELIIDDTTRDGDEYKVTTPDKIFVASFLNNSLGEIATSYSGGDFHKWIADPNDYTRYTYIDTYGNNIEYNSPSGSPASVTVMIPESIVEPKVFITSGAEEGGLSSLSPFARIIDWFKNLF
jgi:hypothetical protein